MKEKDVRQDVKDEGQQMGYTAYSRVELAGIWDGIVTGAKMF